MTNINANTCDLEKHYKNILIWSFFQALSAISTKNIKYLTWKKKKNLIFENLGIGIWRKKCVNYDKIKIAQHCVNQIFNQNALIIFLFTCAS